MLAKLAARNVRRSVRDYAIYFVTLVFGVAVFYAFNSVQGQQVLFDISDAAAEANSNVFNMTGQFLGMLSVVIACVLGFLVIYANRFLIRRRKREFGTYLLLGMRPGQVSAIVLMETVGVGLVSLAVGLALGVGLSQGLSFFTASLFDIEMSQYRFVFSPQAFGLTLACFAVIYVVVALFNTLTVRRCKLADLLSATARPERFRVRSAAASLVGFVLAVALLTFAYLTLQESGVIEFGNGFVRATVLMVIGTFLLFWSGAGFVLALIARTRGLYFRRLALFTMNQIAAKVNTAFLSLSVVTIMLFFAITVFSTGSGLVQAFTGDVETGTHFDATVTANVWLDVDDTNQTDGYYETLREGDPAAAEEYAAAARADDERLRAKMAAYDGSIEQRLRETYPEWDDFVGSATQVDLWWPGYATNYADTRDTETYGELMARLGASTDGSAQNERLATQSLVLISQSQFNAVRAQDGADPIDVGERGYAVNNTADVTEGVSRAAAQEGTTVRALGEELTATGQYLEQPLQTTMFLSDGCEIIVPDWLIAQLQATGELPYASMLNVDYRVDAATGDAQLAAALDAARSADGQAASEQGMRTSTAWPATVSLTATEAVAQAGGMRMMITYLALYIGFVFLVTTAALLAIQQLSEVSDSLPRYRTLAELGCDRRMVLGSLRTQTAVYFLAPLVVAVCHAACAIDVLSREVFAELGVSVGGPIALTVVAVIAVYGGYLVVTYLAGRSIVQSALGRKLLG